MFPGISLLLGTSLAFGPAVIGGEWTKSSCRFSVSGKPAAPSVVGPDEIVDRIVLLAQPDSPLEIVSADFTEAIFVADGARTYFEDGYSLAIRNRSDRPIFGFRSNLTLRSKSGASGGGYVWRGVLSPGEVLEITERPGKGHAEEEGSVRLFVWLEAITFDECEYNPSTGFPAFLER